MEIENEKNFTPKKQILTEKVICPNCTRSVKILLKNNLFKSNGININQKFSLYLNLIIFNALIVNIILHLFIAFFATKK